MKNVYIVLNEALLILPLRRQLSSSLRRHLSHRFSVYTARDKRLKNGIRTCVTAKIVDVENVWLFLLYILADQKQCSK